MMSCFPKSFLLPQDLNDSSVPELVLSNDQEENHLGLESSGAVSIETTAQEFHTYQVPAVEDAVDEDDISNSAARMDGLQINFADPPGLSVNNTETAVSDVTKRTTGFRINFNNLPELSLGAIRSNQSNNEVPSQHNEGQRLTRNFVSPREMHAPLSGGFYGELVIQTQLDAISTINQISQIEPGTNNLILYTYGSVKLLRSSGASIQYRERQHSRWVGSSFAMYGFRSSPYVPLFAIARALELAVTDSELERDGRVVILTNSSVAMFYIQQLASIPECPRNMHMRRIFTSSQLLYERGVKLELHWSPEQIDLIGSARAEGYSNMARKEARHFFHDKIFTTCPIAVILPIKALKYKKNQMKTLGKRACVKARKEAERFSVASGSMPEMVLGRYTNGLSTFVVDLM